MSKFLGVALKHALFISAWLCCFRVQAQFPIEVSYQLPTDTSNKTFRVTIAAAPANDPDWIVSTFLAGAVRTVDTTNNGFFTESWGGTNDDYAALPYTNYVFKGIYMPAYQWNVDSGYGLKHSINAKYVMSVGNSLSPKKGKTYNVRSSVAGAMMDFEGDRLLPWIWGWNYGYPGDIDVFNNIAALSFQRIENTWAFFHLNMEKPIDYDQCTGAAPFPIGGYPCGWYESNQLLGSDVIACNGWRMYGAKMNAPSSLFRPDALSGSTYYDTRPYWSYGALSGPPNLEAWETNHYTYVYVPQVAANKLLVVEGGRNDYWPASKQVGVLLQTAAVTNPTAVVMDPRSAGTNLFVMHKYDADWVVSSFHVTNGIIVDTNALNYRFTVPPAIFSPSDMEVDWHGRFYFCSPSSNLVFQYDPVSSNLDFIGDGAVPEPGQYKRGRFFKPTHVAMWKDSNSVERLLVVEHGGPNRISEWSVGDQTNEFARQWLFCQDSDWTCGFAVDPANPSHVYTRNSYYAPWHIVRYVVDYSNGTWDVDAVWPETIGGNQFIHVVRHTNGNSYIAFPGGSITYSANYSIYRIDSTNSYLLHPSAAVLPDASSSTNFWWHDANNDGLIDASELSGRFSGGGAWSGGGGERWGDSILDDLTWVISSKSEDRFYALSPSGFDAQGNPIYNGSNWVHLFRDEGTERKATGTSSPLYCSTEVSCSAEHWVDIDGSMQDGLYATHDFGSLGGAVTPWEYHKQFKLTKYVPDGQGGWDAKFRIGQKTWTLELLPLNAKVSAASMVTEPVHGILGVMDRRGMYHLFTDDGLYVDMVGIDRYRQPSDDNLLHKRYQGGFGQYLIGDNSSYGVHFLNKEDGKVYLAMPRGGMSIFEMVNWTSNTVKRLNVGEQPSVGFRIPAASSVEASSNIVLDVILGRAFYDTVTVSYVAWAGTATNHGDYELAEGSLSFDPGVTNRSFSLDLLDDDLDEGDEYFIIALTNAVNGRLVMNQYHTRTIVDNDMPSVRFGAPVITKAESAGVSSVPVVLTKASPRTVRASLSVSDVTATRAVDYAVPTSPTGGVCAGWANSVRIVTAGYTNRTETLTNFPVLVRINTSIPGFSYSGFLSGTNSDLRFARDDESEFLNYEIETWNTNGESCIWVQVPLISGPSSAFRMYWGQAGIPPNPPFLTNGATWSANYAAVYHFNTTGTEARVDSTANKNNAATVGCEGDEDVAGIIGVANNFDGVNDSCVAPDSASLDITAKITISVWLNAARWTNSAGGLDTVIARKEASYRFYNRDLGTGSSAMTLKSNPLPDPDEVNHAISNYPTGAWHFVVGVYDGAALRLYKNGVQVASANTVGTMTAGTDPLCIGKKSDNTYYFAGLMDEMELANTARSADWIWAMWNSQRQGSDFLRFEEAIRVVFEPGQTETGVTVNVIEDTEAEQEETFELQLTAAEQAEIGSPDRAVFVIRDNEDTDGDGMPDWWEGVYGRNASSNDAMLDPDDDGMPNMDEYKAGTNPTNENSVLAFSDARRGDGNTNFVFRWLSASNRMYSIRRSTNMLSADWLQIGTNIVADPPANVYTDRPSDGTKLFYKIKLEE